MAQVVLENIYKSFPRQGKQAASTGSADATAEVNVLRRINLTVQDSEFMVLVGPSGCGKSTLLRLIAGLETLTGGNIWVGDRLINTLPPKQRDIAMVFQSYALYPHMTVYENLAFGLRRAKQTSLGGGGSEILASLTRGLPGGLGYQSKREKLIAQRVETVAQMLQIETLLERLPKQLSGGQKQRVALGRAMARNPQVFLMDEPLSNLDAKLRTETRTQIVNLQRKLGTTTIYVTHDQTEAMTMGDRIAVMNGGQIQQLATPLDLYNHPANRFVAEFIGSPPMNFLAMQVTGPLTLSHPQFQLALSREWEDRLRNYVGHSVTVGIRPEHLQLSEPAPTSLPVQVQRVEALGSETYLTVQVPDSDSWLQVRTDPDRPLRTDDRLSLKIPLEKLHLFDSVTGEAIG